ncbi:hypothetical protein RhoFasB10_03812 [Rhodococcus sp. B10]|nr:hypothetical protein [Rhodococcus sp. B10]
MKLREAKKRIGSHVIYTSPVDPNYKEDGVIESVCSKWVHVRYGHFTVTPTHPDNLSLPGGRP